VALCSRTTPPAFRKIETFRIRKTSKQYACICLLVVSAKIRNQERMKDKKREKTMFLKGALLIRVP
jgi:hypothetical protein